MAYESSRGLLQFSSRTLRLRLAIRDGDALRVAIVRRLSVNELDWSLTRGESRAWIGRRTLPGDSRASLELRIATAHALTLARASREKLLKQQEMSCDQDYCPMRFFKELRLASRVRFYYRDLDAKVGQWT